MRAFWPEIKYNRYSHKKVSLLNAKHRSAPTSMKKKRKKIFKKITTQRLSTAFPKPLLPVRTWAHSFERFEKHVLLKARTQCPWFSYPRPVCAFQSVGSADLLSFGGDSVSLMPGAKFIGLYSQNAMQLRVPRRFLPISVCTTHRGPLPTNKSPRFEW